MKRSMMICAAGMLVFSAAASAQTIPTPEHVVVLVLENRSYSNIIGNSNAPYINSLASDPANAVFTQSFGLTHPSQPNYIMLFSGHNQGVTNNNDVSNSPFSTCNLGASLLAAGHTFKGYSDDLPYVGALDFYYANYVRKHAPWTHWQGTGANQLPPSSNQPFTNFPTNFSSLPTLSFVIPNQVHNMHDPISNPSVAIANGDAWVSSNLTNCINWARNSNNLFILTFDEDDGNSNNRITTIFIGGMVQGGTYSNHIDHYDMLRTLEDMYNLPHCANSANATPITNCWKPLTTDVQSSHLNHTVAIGPVPAHDHFNLSVHSSIGEKIDLTIYDMAGRLVKDEKLEMEPGKNTFKIDAAGMSAGLYVVKLKSSEVDLTRKIIIE